MKICGNFILYIWSLMKFIKLGFIDIEELWEIVDGGLFRFIVEIKFFILKGWFEDFIILIWFIEV